MKICYINPTVMVRRPIAEIIGRLSKKHEITLFIPRKIGKEVNSDWHNSELLKNANIISYPVINLPLNFEWPIPITPSFYTKLYQIFKKNEVVHMWTYFYISTFFASLFSRFFKKTRFILSCDTLPAYSFKTNKIMDIMFKTYTKLFRKLLFNTPNKIHLYGKALFDVAKSMKIDHSKIKVIPTGINLEKFKNKKNRKTIRKDLGFEEKDKILVYAGLMIPRKGIDTMLQTLSRINDERVKLLLIGEGPKKKKYERMSEKMNLKQQVRFLGWRKDIPDLLNASDILLLPSRAEGIPGIVMEGMAAGLPVVASNIPCTDQLVQEGENGYLCETGSISCFAEKIKKALEDKNYQRFSRASKEKIKDFNWDNLIKKYEELYA